MSKHARFRFAMALAALAVWLPAAAFAVEDATLVDPDLHEQSIRFVSLSDGRLTYFDTDRRLRTASVDGFVLLRWDRTQAGPKSATAIVSASASAQSRWPNVAYLADGHVVRGRFAGVDAEGRVRWQTSNLGELTFTLDQLNRFDCAADAAAPGADASAGEATAGQDVVTLQNGDRLVGFVAKVGTTGVSLEANNETLPLSWGGVRSVQLANPMRNTPGVWMRLVDGTRLLVDRVDIGSIQAIGQAFGREVVVPVKAIAGIDFALKHRLMRLSELKAKIMDGGSVFGVPMPPRFDDGAAELHAPITLRFELPEGVHRFAATASLDDRTLDWADLNLTVADGKGKSFVQRLNADHPSATVNVPLRDRTLILQLDNATNGPVLDRLTLSNAVLLITNEH
ncbi:MAG: hypothetical protein GC159_21050 [Phycisphaera sp.]|nr:hypothetical protein [Phycisphaera sp.]